MAYKDDERRKAYFREYNKGWYQRHKDRLLEKRRQHKEELKTWLRTYKTQLRCTKCGENHPACLQFHHLNREEKSFTIGSIITGRRYMTIDKLEKEINKCDVLVEIVMRYIIGERCMMSMTKEKCCLQ
jgi:transcription elongation factor Elf1